ncbi:MAG TPA: DUF6228 family protein [Pantanalinema sp.]
MTASPTLSIPPLGRNKLILSNPSFSDSLIDEFTASLEVDGLQASATIDDYLGGGLPEFFQDLAEHWQEWSGEKVWKSRDGVLQIACTSDRTGQHQMAVTLDPARLMSTPWTVKATLQIEAGQLEQISNTSRAFFAFHQ